jgi:hypothetical protein
MNIKKGKYYRFNGPNGFTVKALDNSYGDTFSAVVVLQGGYQHKVGDKSSIWSTESFIKSDLSEFLVEAKKRYPMGSRYVSLGGDPDGKKGFGVSYVEYEPKIWYYGNELRGVEVGNYVVYNFCIDKWAEQINDQVDTDETLFEAEFDLTTDDGRLAYAKKYYPIGTKYIPIDCVGDLYSSVYTSRYEAKFWNSGSSIEVGEGLIYHDSKWAEITKKVESKEETKMETQKLSRNGLKEIHSVACSSWKTTLEEFGTRNPLEDYIELLQEEVDIMFDACTKEQLPIVSKYLKQDDGSVGLSFINNKKLLEESYDIIGMILSGDYAYKSFRLTNIYDWEIKKDIHGFICLIPTKKK